MQLADTLARRLLKQWLRLGLEKKRGGWRVAAWLAKDQRSALVRVGNLAPFYVDLRSFDLLEISLFLAAPDEPVFEKEDRALFRQLVKPGDVVFDIGANIGYHLSLFASLAGPSGTVYGFEPQPGLLPNLRRTVAEIPNAKLMECALSDTEGEVVLHVPDHGYHMLASLSDPGVPSNEVRCVTATLDGLLASQQITAPDFIKLDVEGAELLVLRGASRLLNDEHAPLVFFEQWPEAALRSGFAGDGGANFLLSLERAQFALFGEIDGHLRPVTLNNQEKRNLLAVPKARVKRLNL